MQREYIAENPATSARLYICTASAEGFPGLAWRSVFGRSIMRQRKKGRLYLRCVYMYVVLQGFKYRIYIYIYAGLRFIGGTCGGCFFVESCGFWFDGRERHAVITGIIGIIDARTGKKDGLSSSRGRNYIRLSIRISSRLVFH